MKVSSIKNAFHSMVEDFSATKSQKLNKLTKTRVQIHSDGMSKDVLEQLETAKKTLGNYAHAKDVYISIGAAKHNKMIITHIKIYIYGLLIELITKQQMQL